MNKEDSINRVVICGLGSIGRRHIRVINEINKDIEISILRSGLGPNSEEENNAKHIFYDIKDAINWNPDAAIIASPASIHLTQALEFARGSIPMLIEKPIGDRSNDYRWKKLADFSNSILITIGYILRHDPLTKIIKKELNLNTIGSLVSADFYAGSWLPDWRPGQDYTRNVSAIKALGGGVILELSHEIDLAHYLFGKLNLDYAYTSNSMLLNIEKEVEDRASLFLTTHTGVPIHIGLDFCSKPPRRQIRIRGQKGEIYTDIIKREVTISTLDKQPHTLKSNVRFNDLYKAQTLSFFRAITEMSSPTCSVSDALATLKIADEAKNNNTNTTDK